MLNTIADIAMATNHALSAFGYPTHSEEKIKNFVGNGVSKLLERALPEDKRTEENIALLREAFTEYYDKHNADLSTPYPGIASLLSQLQENGVLLAVASNKYQSATEKIVAQLFPSIFDIVLGEREGIARKPNPQIVYDILDSQLVSPNSEDILYIGDSLVDAETAKAAKLPFVACTWGFCTREQLQTAQPHYMVSHPSEILGCLEVRG